MGNGIFTTVVRDLTAVGTTRSRYIRLVVTQQ
jgi:hypothetical protein